MTRTHAGKIKLIFVDKLWRNNGNYVTKNCIDAWAKSSLSLLQSYFDYAVVAPKD